MNRFPQLIIIQRWFFSMSWKEYKKITKLPIIYVTHDTRDAISFADRVIVLSSKPTKVQKIIDTKEIKLLSMPMEKEICGLLEGQTL